jgi:hypothetical protein
MTPMPMTICPLLAAGFDWLEALLPLLFVAFWFVSQVFAVFRRLQGGGQRPQPPVRIDRLRPQPVPAGDVRSELERQIEEFLRQSAAGQGRQPPGPAAAGDRRRDEPQRSQPRPAAATPRPSEQPRADRPATARPPRERKPEAGLQPRPAQPPAAPAQGDAVARHVQDAFSHDLAHTRGGLGNEAAGPDAATPRPSSLTAELAELLRSPAATRRAILLREVLDRPVDRW